MIWGLGGNNNKDKDNGFEQNLSPQGRKFGRRRQNEYKEDPPVESSDSSEQYHTALARLSLSDESMSVAETGNGIEISVEWELAKSPSAKKELVSLYQFLRRRRTKRRQFSVDFPALKKIAIAAAAQANAKPALSGVSTHRISLAGNEEEETSLEEQIFLLQSHKVKDELTSVRTEAAKVNAEIEALEKDLMELEQDFLCIPKSSALQKAATWDVDHLISQRHSLSKEDLVELQRLRGRCVTMQLQNPKTRDVLNSKLGILAVPRRNKYRQSARMTLTPADCRSGGAGQTLRHISLLPGTQHATSVYLNHDNGDAWGQVPQPLFRRMRKQNLTVDMLKYLAAGPGGCYFAQFNSGHIMWGCSDPEFDAVVKTWNVYRVAFGPIVTFADLKVHSWIVVTREGRVAWKNLPTRLSHKLESRLANNAAPAEISLGSDESYFVRFLDGSIDYCLPSSAAQVCEYIIKQGAKVTNIILHAELSKDFIVRHTEMKL